MSIHDAWSKIKTYGRNNHLSLIYILIILMVAISSFGLGRLSTNYSSDNNTDVTITDVKDLSSSVQNKSEIQNTDMPASPLNNQSKGKYVASKNGKLYYTPGCSGAKRIKPENQVWFQTISDAEKMGYTLSSSCKQ